MSKPNIVWLTQDHVVWKHFRDTEGPKPPLSTYERIASTGVAFERAHTVTPLCSPARASMVTGAYAHRHGITRNHNGLRNRINPETETYNVHLQKSGYRTAFFGKWHAGEGIPDDFGFEGFSLPGYGNPYSSPEYTQYLERYQLPEPIVDIEWSTTGQTLENIPLTKISKFAGIDPDTGFRSDAAGVFKTPLETTEAHFIARLACDWLEDQARDKDPFVLRVDVWGPHQPYLVADPFKDTVHPLTIPEYPNFGHTFEDRPEYHKQDRQIWRERTGFTRWDEWQPVVARAYEHFAQTDAALGHIVDALERLGLSENTILIYTADHGDILASNGGLFDKDSMMTEETMSIPLAVSWPGVTDKGHSCDRLVSNMDIVPTILELAGVEIPEYMDAQSFARLLHNPNGTFREALMAQHFGHINYDKIQRVLYYNDYKYVAHLDDSDELYDLRKDPFELKNLIDDPSHKAVLHELKTQLGRKMRETDDVSNESLQLLTQKQIGWDERG